MLFPSSSQVDVAVNNVLTLHLVGDAEYSEKEDQQLIRKCFSGVKLIIKHKRWFVGPLSLQLCIFARYLHVQYCTCAVYSAAEGCWAQLMVSRGPVNMWPHASTRTLWGWTSEETRHTIILANYEAGGGELYLARFWLFGHGKWKTGSQ